MGDKKSPTAPLTFPEPPTAAARLVIQLGPAQLAEGTVPPDQARHLITTFGISGCVLSGIGGAVLTLRIAPGRFTLAFAELALALAGAALIALAALMPARQRDTRSGTGPDPPGRPSQPGDGRPDGTARLRPAAPPSKPPPKSC